MKDTDDTDDFVVQLLRENRRLRKENERLAANESSIESNLWWRLHPRRHLRRITTVVRRSAPVPLPASTPEAPRPPQARDDLCSRFRREVVERGAFTRDWFTENVSSWEPMMEELDGRGARTLEIGCFEGMSACYVLWRLRDSHVTCVDTFEGGPEHIAGQHLPDAGLETVFDANVALVDASRVRKLVGDSKRMLVDLLAERARFDFVYVDGSHLALDVLADAALSWRLLATGGFLIFDDYNWAEFGEDRLLRPGAAVDSFLVLIEGKYELVASGWQVALRKSAA
jgi:SAM-dependent methyltransferase